MRLRIRVAGMTALLLLWSKTAHAIDAGIDGNLASGTAGLREWNKKSTGAKKYGAERIADRDRTPFQPDGIRAGRLILLPSFGVTGIYNDNIFATAQNTKADYRSELTPSLRVFSNFTRHRMKFSLGSKIVSHRRHKELDFIDANARFDGGLHIDHAHTLSLSLSSVLQHEERFDPLTAASAKDPISHWDNSATLALTRDAGRLYGTFSLTAKSVDYNDGKTGTGDVIDQDFRDSQIYSGQLRMGYRFSPGFELVGKTVLLRQQARGTLGENRDNTGYENALGLSFQTSPLLRFSLLAGYGFRDYDNNDVQDFGAAVFEAGVEWLPTRRMTISAKLRREIGDIASAEGDYFISTRLNGRVQYEIWRNLLLNIDGSAVDSTSSSEDRKDRTYGGAIGLEYLHAKNWAFNVSYDYTHRDSNSDEFDFNRNRVRIGAKLRF